MGLAVLSLLSEVAQREPVVCVVDDAQWLDRASTEVLASVARRLLAESVVLLLGARVLDDEFFGPPRVGRSWPWPPRHESLLGEAGAWTLGRAGARADRGRETRGNPLALLELPRGMTPAQLAGGFGLPSMGSLSGQIEEKFLRGLGAPPHDTQRLLLLAAAEPLGDPALLLDAARRLGIGPGAEVPAEQAGLLEVGVRVTFRHPLVRRNDRAASAANAALAYRAPAEVTDPGLDPDRRAWHRAHGGFPTERRNRRRTGAIRGTSSQKARGGLAAAAAFLEDADAAMLTPDQGRRARRSLVAAEAKQQGQGRPMPRSICLRSKAGTTR